MHCALTPAALATALRTRPFPATDLGFAVSLKEVDAPRRAGDQWVLYWQAPAASPQVGFEFWLFGTAKAAAAEMASYVIYMPHIDPYITDISPHPAWCSAAVSGRYSCYWIDNNVFMTCGGTALEGTLYPVEVTYCGSMFAAARQDLRAVDRYGGF